MKRNIFYLFLVMLVMASCSDILDTDSKLVEFEEDNHLNQPEDSVYSVMGIIHRIQTIAVRDVVLGEVRADLVQPTTQASNDLKQIANFQVNANNSYNKISDYYAVINNCNFFLARVDTALAKRGRKVFASEYAAVKAFRAWAYLQAVKVYGKLPLVTEPVLTEQQAKKALAQQQVGIVDVCNYFIDDIKPYVDTDLPNYGQVGGMNSQKFFVPVRALLGDLCLWAGRYQEAATYYHDYLTKLNHAITTNTYSVVWNTGSKDFESFRNGYTSAFSTNSSELLSYIPMETSDFDGVRNTLPDLYNSLEQNYDYFQLTPSQGLANLSAAQIYCMKRRVSDLRTDTVYAPRKDLYDPLAVGDLRLLAAYSKKKVNLSAESKYSSQRQEIGKIITGCIPTYRAGMVYLRFAEALNRAGYPQSAFAVLKYGLTRETIQERVDSVERDAAGPLLEFDANVFTTSNTEGIHDRGCGNSDVNEYYTLPEPGEALASRADTVEWQIPRVEDLIVNEMALEGSYEGYRFYDLMRVALRRNDPSYLAAPVSERNGQRNEALYNLLLDTNNWYLKKNE